MAKKMAERLLGYGQELSAHVRRAVKREEAPKEALGAVVAETAKLFQKLRKGATTHERKVSIDLVKRGMEHYNARRYAEAEELFQRAVSKDPGYARAHAYYANAVYKLGRSTEALAAWNKAINAEPGSDAAKLAEEKIAHVTKRHGSLADAVRAYRPGQE